MIIKFPFFFGNKSRNINYKEEYCDDLDINNDGVEEDVRKLSEEDIINLSQYIPGTILGYLYT